MLAVAGVEDMNADPHHAFDQAYGPPKPAPRMDPEERRAMIAALAGG